MISKPEGEERCVGRTYICRRGSEVFMLCCGEYVMYGDFRRVKPFLDIPCYKRFWLIEMDKNDEYAYRHVVNKYGYPVYQKVGEMWRYMVYLDKVESDYVVEPTVCVLL